MPNRDYEDSQYNRPEGRSPGRDEQSYRDQGERGESGGERQNDDYRRDASGRERGYGADYQSLREQHQQRLSGSGYGRERGGLSGAQGERGGQGERDGQRLGQQEWSRSVGAYRPVGQDYGRQDYGRQDYGRPDYGRQDYGRQDYGRQEYGRQDLRGRDWNDRSPQGSYAPEWRSYAQDWSDHGRAQSDARQQQDWGSDARAENPFNAQERNRQEWNRTIGAGSYGRPGYGPSFSGSPSYGRDEHEGWGEQIRHAGQQVVSRVKRAFRGPKGYKRSDERIREDVNDRLAQQFDFDPSDVEVAVSGGEVTLTGTVRSRHEKFIAEEIADEVSGVNEVQNQLRVKREELAATTTSGGASSSPSTTLSEGNNNNRNAPRA